MNQNVQYETATPNVAALMQSLRAFGYDVATAVADLIDNSITAGAKHIAVNFNWNNSQPYISITDDGCGMTEPELSNAMKMGSKNPLMLREENDLGRFGLGLKTASFSQAKVLTVATRTLGETDIHIRCWDLDYVSLENKWYLLKTCSDSAKKVFDCYFSTHETGTVVMWEKLDRLVAPEHVEDESYQMGFLSHAKSVKKHISVVFSNYMYGPDKIEFKLNDRVVQLWDPFMSNHKLTTLLPSESIYLGASEVKVRTYILPHQSKLSSEEFAANAGEKGWFEQQGFYVYRQKRLIVAANWLLPELAKKESYRLARVRIDIGNQTDNEWAIDVRKSLATPPIEIQKEIKRIALAAQRESAKIFQHRGKKIARKGKQEQSFVWHQNLRQGKLGYKINRDHPFIKPLLASDVKTQVKQLLNLIEETVPVPMIISDYNDNSHEMLAPFEGSSTSDFEEMMMYLYKKYLSSGYEPQEAIQRIANTEPFIYAPDKVALFSEKVGVQIE